MVLCANLGAILTIKQQYSRIRYVQGCNCSTYKVITTRAVDNIEFLAVPFYMIDGRENRVTILLFYGEIVADGIFLRDATATFYNTTLIEQGFRESGFT